jgi:hypothetical protein
VAFDPGGFSSEFGPGTPPPIPPPPPQDLTMVPTPIGVFNPNGAASYYLYSQSNNGQPVHGAFGMGQVAQYGWDGTAYGYGAALYFRAVGNWTPTSHGTEMLFFTTPVNGVAAAANAGVTAGGALWCGGPGVLATNATDGFFGTPTMAGAPTGVPVINYNTAPMVFDTTNNVLRIYDAGWFALATQGQPAAFTTLTATTPATADNSVNVATTAFVKAQGYGTGNGTITGVSAGAGLTGGGVTGAVTLSLVTPVAVANGGTGVTTSTGTGANVLSTNPVLVTPALGTPSSGNLANCLGLPLGTGVTGQLPVANGGTGATTTTGTGANVLGTSPTFTTNLTVTGAGPTAIAVDGPAGQQRLLQFTTGGSLRWQFICSAAAESGSNAGSNFSLGAYSDTGVLIVSALSITRATGLVNITSGLSVSNGLTVQSGGLTLFGLPQHGVLVGQAGVGTVTGVSAGTAGQLLTSQGGTADPTFTAAVGSQTGFGNPNPAAPGTAAYTMMGMGGTPGFNFTPTRTGRILIHVSGEVTMPNAAAAGVGLQTRVYWGTGAAPANGAALTGTAVGQVQRCTLGVAQTGQAIIPFCTGAFIINAVVGTPLWFDIAAQAVGSAGAALTNVLGLYMEQ